VSAADYALAFSAGAVSFVSPCVLPLVPVYLSVTTGLDVDQLTQRGAGTVGRVLRGACLFILGFSTVFVVLGLSATALGGILLRQQEAITRLAGMVVLLLSVAMLLSTTSRGLQLPRERRFHPAPGARSWSAPTVTGAAFAFGWTPCVGPVLGSVLAIAATQDGVLRGGALLATYSAGLAVPLLVTGLAFARAVGPLRWTRRHSLGLTRGVAVVLACYGVLLGLDRLAWLTQTLQGGLTAAL
jgi:cytochrome c-type biogenesis protein